MVWLACHAIFLPLFTLAITHVVYASARERVTERGYLNGDGFGLGWYPVPAHMRNTPAVFTKCDDICITSRVIPHSVVICCVLLLLLSNSH